MTPDQCIAARQLLGWSRLQLAVVAHCSSSTVASFEEQKRSPHGSIRTSLETAFAAAGVGFADGSPVWKDADPPLGVVRSNLGWGDGGPPASKIIRALQELTAQAEAEGFTDTVALLKDTLAEMRGGARANTARPDRKAHPLA